MLAFGAGGLEVALALAGQPFYLRMPRTLGVRLTGRLPDWVSAKDVILEMLRRYGVEGCIGTAANMGTEMGATMTVFPSDGEVRRFLEREGRGDVWSEVQAEEGVRAVLAKSFARIHQQNLANFGVLPLVFEDRADYDRVRGGDRLRLPGLRDRLSEGRRIVAENRPRDHGYPLSHDLSSRQVRMILAGSILNLV